MKKLRALWASLMGDADRRVRLGRVLGMALIVIGFAVIAKAWDGAASQLYLPAMFPYLLSGGFLGLGLVITGAMLLFLATLRAERQILTDRYEQMATLLSRNLARMAVSVNGSESSGEHVIAGATAYHRPGCRVLQGKDDLMPIPLAQAAAEGLAACRVCDPPTLPDNEEDKADVVASADGSGGHKASDPSEAVPPEKKEAEAASAGETISSEEIEPSVTGASGKPDR